jgi:hypothetical protein
VFLKEGVHAILEATQMLELAKREIAKAVLFNSSGFQEGGNTMFDCVLVPKAAEKNIPSSVCNCPPSPGVLNGLREAFRKSSVSHGVILGHTFIRLISWPLCKPEGLDYFGGNFSGAIRMYYGGIPVEYLPRDSFTDEANEKFLSSLRKALTPVSIAQAA